MDKTYDPSAFAQWLSEAFYASSFKSWQQIAYTPELRGVRGATRSTLSRYASAKPQLLTNQPSQPNPDLVIALAKVFKKDINEALRIAGHAPLNTETTGYFKGLEKLSPEDQKRAKRQIRAIIDSYIDDEEKDEDFDYI